MRGAANHDPALLILRLSVAWVFLFAAWKNTENSAAWEWTKNETGLLFASLPSDKRATLTLVASLIGMALMYGGGVSILLGIEPRLGGFAIAVFSLMGMKLHAIRRDEAKQAAE